MPVDLYVDAARGSDTATGGMTDPFRSLARAAMRAAELDLGGETGTIRAAAGTYAFPAENFPVIVPASFDLLGAGRDRTVVVFTGETREYAAEDGTTILYWGGEAIVGGRSVRGLTLRAEPAPYFTCFGMTGIRTTINGTVVEDVRVYIDPAESPIPEGEHYTEVGFGRELWASGIEITVLDCLFERASRRGLTLGLCDGAVLRTTSDNANFFAGSDGSLTVDGCTFLNTMDVRLHGHATIRSSRFDGSRLNVFVHYDGNRFGPDNDFRGNIVEVGGTSEIYRNALHLGYSMWVYGNARIVENDIFGGVGTARLLDIRSDSGTPVIQGNRFVALPFFDPALGRNGTHGLVYPHDLTPIEISGSADFGGGTSMGGNDFSEMFNDLSVYHPSRIRIDAPGATVRFDDNFWADPLSARERRFEVLSPDTTLSLLNPMPAP